MRRSCSSCQIENEYGSNPACDLDYMRALTQAHRDILGDDILLYSVNGPGKIDSHLFFETIALIHSDLKEMSIRSDNALTALKYSMMGLCS